MDRSPMLLSPNATPALLANPGLAAVSANGMATQAAAAGMDPRGRHVNRCVSAKLSGSTVVQTSRAACEEGSAEALSLHVATPLGHQPARIRMSLSARGRNHRGALWLIRKRVGIPPVGSSANQTRHRRQPPVNAVSSLMEAVRAGTLSSCQGQHHVPALPHHYPAAPKPLAAN